MIVGIDFDNTIIDYDNLFIKAAINHGWLDDRLLTKKEVKQGLVDKYGEDSKWQILQAEVYGKCITDADLFTDCREFIKFLVSSGSTVYIVSHKTEFSNFDGKTRLIKPAIKWLVEKKLIGSQGLLPVQQVSFHPTREEKTLLLCNALTDSLKMPLGSRH